MLLNGIYAITDELLTPNHTIFTRGFIGVSCYGSIKKALQAQHEGVDYVAFGSFFPSPRTRF